MAYKALYRTYRPSTFEEVAGQQHIVKTIKNALATGKIAHAYLFAGPRGTGKTTMAKLLAKALNCEEGIGHQCNNCKNCKSIIDGTHPDVLEIDAASNNGVEEIRDLIDKVKYGTILGKYKVYIIDEVHMMTTQAFNALLKTLEEPPEHVIFILATTEPHKILPTILSRCQRYDFTKVSDQDIKQRIKDILEKESIDYNEEAIDLIISLADGGMRDALSILDQVLAYSGNQLNVKDILDIFALESTEEKINLLNNVISGNTAEVLKKLNSYIAKGTDIKRLTNDLLVILKDVLVFNTTNSTYYSEALKDSEVKQLARTLNKEDNIKMIDILMDATKDFKNVSSINPLFEITLLKLTSLHSLSSTVKNEVSKVEVQPTPKPVEQVKEEVVAPAVEEVVKQEINLIDNPKTLFLKDCKQDGLLQINDTQIIEIMAVSKREIKTQLLDNWSQIKLLNNDPKVGQFATILSQGRPLVASLNLVILEFPTTQLVEKINKVEVQNTLQNIIESALNKKLFIYPVNRSDSIRLQQKYMNLLQIGRLPNAKEVVIEMEEE